MFGSPTRTRTRDQLINSQSLYQLSYRGMLDRVPDAEPNFGPRAPPSQGSVRLRQNGLYAPDGFLQFVN